MYYKNNIFSSKHLGYFLVGSFDDNSAFSLRPRLQTFSNPDIKPLSLLFVACSIDSLQQNQEKMRWQNTLLFHIAFTKHGISFPRSSWVNSVGFASLPDVGKPKWNSKMSSSLGLVLKCRPRCFSPEVLKKQHWTKNYQTQFKCSVNNSGLLQKHNWQDWFNLFLTWLMKMLLGELSRVLDHSSSQPISFRFASPD